MERESEWERECVCMFVCFMIVCLFHWCLIYHLKRKSKCQCEFVAYCVDDFNYSSPTCISDWPWIVSDLFFVSGRAGRFVLLICLIGWPGRRRRPSSDWWHFRLVARRSGSNSNLNPGVLGRGSASRLSWGHLDLKRIGRRWSQRDRWKTSYQRSCPYSAHSSNQSPKYLYANYWHLGLPARPNSNRKTLDAATSHPKIP